MNVGRSAHPLALLSLLGRQRSDSGKLLISTHEAYTATNRSEWLENALSLTIMDLHMEEAKKLQKHIFHMPSKTYCGADGAAGLNGLTQGLSGRQWGPKAP